MASAARSWQHPRWQYDDDGSEAAQRSAARTASQGTTKSRGGAAVPRVSRPSPGPRVVPAPLPSALPRLRWHNLRAAGFIVLAGAALVIPVSLNMAATGAEYRYAQLEDRQGALRDERSALQAKVAALTSHQRVEAAAQSMGMVRALHSEFLDMGAADSAEGVAGSADSGSVR